MKRRLTAALALAALPLSTLATEARADEATTTTQVTTTYEGAAPPRSGPPPLEDHDVVVPALVGISYAVANSSSLERLGALGALSGGVAYAAGPLVFRSYENGPVKSRVYGAAPSADVVLGRRLTLGGTISATWASVETPAVTQMVQSTSLELAGGPRVGLLVPLGHGVTFWPKVEATVARIRSERDAADGNPGYDIRATRVRLAASTSFVFPVTRHLFFSLTPTLGYLSTFYEGDLAAEHSVVLATAGALGLAF